MTIRREIESAIQQGRTEALKWFEEYERAENQEEAEQALALLLGMLPPEAHAMLEQINPQMHKRLMERAQKVGEHAS